MTPKQLKKRQTLVKASPVKKISSIKTFSRRDPNNIVENKEAHPNDAFDSFFDFEEDISSLKPSSEQFVMESNRDPSDSVETENDYPNDQYTIMSPISSDSPVIMKKNNVTQN